MIATAHAPTARTSRTWSRGQTPITLPGAEWRHELTKAEYIISDLERHIREPLGVQGYRQSRELPGQVMDDLPNRDPPKMGRVSRCTGIGVIPHAQSRASAVRAIWSDGELVAVKVAHASLAVDEVTRARFRAEADHLAPVPAHCTARLLADGIGQTPPHIITEYIAGRSLKDVVEQDGPLPLEQLRALATGLARTLASIHQAGLVHRDLKPANVLLTPTGPWVIDFGIAQEVSASGGPTGTGMVVGSIGWIAPERLTRHQATPASDVFGWGCLVAYAGTARHPYGAGDADELARRVIFEPPDLDGLDVSLKVLVTAALAKLPADRPSSTRLLARLGPAGAFAESEPLQRSNTTRLRTEETPHAFLLGMRQRRKALVVALAASAVVAGAATATVWVSTGAGESAPQPVHVPAGQPKDPGATAGTAITSREFLTHEPGTRPTGPADLPTGKKPPAGTARQDKKPGHGKKGPGAR